MKTNNINNLLSLYTKIERLEEENKKLKEYIEEIHNLLQEKNIQYHVIK